MSHRNLGKKKNKNPTSMDVVVPGIGWSCDPDIPAGNCDGQYHSICGRKKDSKCLLSGHMDARGGLYGDGFSGWLVFDLPQVREGLVILKLETWHKEKNDR